MRAFKKVNDHTIIAYCSKSQQMRCVVCHNIYQEIIGIVLPKIGKDWLCIIKTMAQFP